ncbi:MAG: zinc-ribbon domain-containing protein [Proteobacteria bacterium]|nr:zinc-ribbon domain-containing protein [Pseudomonadota bacterium]
MDINCDNCKSKFRVPDEKIPAGIESIPCPKCKNRIVLSTGQKTGELSLKEEPAGRSDSEALSFDEAQMSDSYDASEKPFDFVEEEGKTALVCESDPERKKQIIEALHLMEFNTNETDNSRDVLKKMRYHVYDLIVLNEKFDTPNHELNPIMMAIDRLPISTRRNIFVALISDRFRTMDNMTAFQKSVNIIINTKNMEDFGKILSRGITDHESFYRVFKETLKKLGRT